MVRAEALHQLLGPLRNSFAFFILIVPIFNVITLSHDTNGFQHNLIQAVAIS